jgi:hypothetical protein
MAATLKTLYHIRGMTDSAGSPGATIETTKFDHWNDGSFRFTLDGKTYKVRGGTATAKLFQHLFGIGYFVGDEG